VKVLGKAVVEISKSGIVVDINGVLTIVLQTRVFGNLAYVQAATVLDSS